MKRRLRYSLLFVCLSLALAVSIKLGFVSAPILGAKASDLEVQEIAAKNLFVNSISKSEQNLADKLSADSYSLKLNNYQSNVETLISDVDLSNQLLLSEFTTENKTIKNVKQKNPAKTNTSNTLSESDKSTSAKTRILQVAQQSKRPPATITTGVPEGFEDLLEPQIALVDIYYNGQPLSSGMATYTHDWLQFEQPEDILQLITELTEPQIVLEKLKSRLSTNTSQVCYYKAQRDCGYLSPEIAGVIFDEGTFKVDLFINPLYVNVTHLQLEQYLPPSTSQLSIINSISLAASGGENVEDIHAVQLTSILGYQNYRVQMNVDHDSENQTRLDQLSLIYDYRDIAYEIGSFKSFTQSNGFYTQRDFLGARIQTSLSSRTDLEQLSGSAVFVFLSERSRVDVFKDGQLIDTRSYDAGNVEIDTRNFPQGAYDITLKIVGDSARETTETHFYSKSLRLPPLGETLYFAELGVPETINAASTTIGTSVDLPRYPHGESHSVFRAGMVSRLSENVGLNASVVSNSDDFSGEFGSFILTNGISFQNNYAISQHDGLGSFYQLDFNREPFIFTASYRKTDRQDDVNYDSEYELLQNDSRQILLNVAVPFDSSTINFFARESQRFSQERIQVYGASWRKNIYRGSGSLVDFSIDATHNDIETQVLFGFNLRFFSNHVDVGLSARQNHTRLHDSSGALVDNHSTNNHIDRKLRVALKNQFEKLGALSNVFEVNQEQLRKTVSLKSELNNEHGFSRIELSQINQTGNKRLGYSMTSRFNIVASNGKVAIGGNRRNSSGVMINLESIESETLSFSVIINGIERAKIDAGKSRFIALQPYQTYQILLSPRGDTLVNYDNKPKVVTLYPGNIENLAWQINEVKVLIMQVFDSNGEPVVNARLKDFNGYARTDDLGWIQLRLERSGELSFVNQAGEECRVNISKQELSETVNYLSEKPCR